MRHQARIEADVADHLVDGVRRAVASGDYASENDAVSDALTHWLWARQAEPISPERLRKMLQDAVDSGPGEDMDVVFDRLKAKYSAMAEAQERER